LNRGACLDLIPSIRFARSTDPCDLLYVDVSINSINLRMNLSGESRDVISRLVARSLVELCCISLKVYISQRIISVIKVARPAGPLLRYVTLVLVYVTGGFISGRAKLVLVVLRQNFTPGLFSYFTTCMIILHCAIYTGIFREIS